MEKEKKKAAAKTSLEAVSKAQRRSQQ